MFHLSDAVEPCSTWRKQYAEKLQVCLAAMELRFAGTVCCLSIAQQKEDEVDLVKGDIVSKIGVVRDTEGLRRFLYLFVPCAS